MGNVNVYPDAAMVKLYKEQCQDGTMRLGMTAESSNGTESIYFTPGCTIRYDIQTRNFNLGRYFPPIDRISTFVRHYFYWTRYDLLFDFIYYTLLTRFPFNWLPFTWIAWLFFTWKCVQLPPETREVVIPDFPRKSSKRFQTRNDAVPWFWRQYGPFQGFTSYEPSDFKPAGLNMRFRKT